MKSKMILSCLLSALIVTSCGDSDSDEPRVLTKEQAQATLNSMSSDATADIIEITQSEGFTALTKFFDLSSTSNLFGARIERDSKSIKSIFISRVRQFKQVFIPGNSVSALDNHDSAFDFQAHWGVYEYNPDTGEFEKTSENVEMIVVKFPTEGSQVNNATLRITAYEEELIIEMIDGVVVDEYYSPTVIRADLTVDEVLLVDLDLQLSYSSNGDPVSGNISLFLNPFRFSLIFDDSQSTVASLSASILKGEETIAAVELTVTFVNQEKEDVEKLEGFIQYRDVKLQGSIDVLGLEALEEGNIDGDPNDFINLALFIGADKIGDIVLVEEVIDGVEEIVLYVEFADGSRERLEDILEQVIMELDVALMDIG